jgi:hypothetical protein
LPSICGDGSIANARMTGRGESIAGACAMQWLVAASDSTLAETNARNEMRFGMIPRHD